jgi:hypothetical protein
VTIRLQYLILAEHLREGAQGKFDLLGPFDRIYAPSVPAQHALMHLVALVVTDDEADLGTHRFRLRFVRPTGAPLMDQTGTMKLKPEGGSWLGGFRFNFALQGVPLPEYGKFRFVLEIDDQEMGVHPLVVARPKSPSGG